jgi:pyruvate formate lyase activating enzyme
MIFDIQKFSTHDGPGIRTVVFFKGCPLSCYWCQNPEGQSFKRELMYNVRECIGCGTCLHAENGRAVLSNPAGGIRVDRDIEPPAVFATVCPTQALQLVGKEMKVEEIIAEVAKDKCFFATSGGGLTLSGGEPLAQIDFAVCLMEAAMAEGLDIAIESSLAVPLVHVSCAAAFPVHWLVDLKHTEASAFRKATGGDVSLVLANLEYLASEGADMVIRVPVIPGFNNDEDVMHGIFQFIAKLPSPRGTRRRVDLLPYHDLAIGKYASLGRSYAIQPGARVPENQMKLFAGMGRALGFEITIGG